MREDLDPAQTALAPPDCRDGRPGERGRTHPRKLRDNVDGIDVGGGAAPGEEAVDNTSSAAQNGFALTFVTAGSAPPFRDGVLRRGRHTVTLSCEKGTGSPKIDQPQISVLGIASG